MKIPLDPTGGAPFWRQVRDHIAAEIRKGALAAHSPLPSLRDLAAATTVSVITIKRAYEELEAAGLVYSAQGRGTFVAPAAVEVARGAEHAAILREIADVVARAAAEAIEPEALTAAFQAAIRDRYRAD